MTAYRNGIAEGTTTTGGDDSTLNKSDRDVLISAYFNNGSVTNGQDFHGQLANLAVWSRCLESEEIQSIMNKSYSQLKGVETTSLEAWWALDDVQKTTDNSVSSGLIESETGEILSSDVSSFNSIAGTGNNYTNNIIEFVANGYAFFNISGVAQGKLYRFTYNVLTQTASGMSHSGGSSAFTGGIPTTVGSHEQYLVAGSANLLVMRSQGFRGTITDIVIQEVSNTGVVTGATTTTSVYGGNAPILPRAVDVAKEGQADAIGDGSARFTESNTDFIEVLDNDLFSFNNNSKDHAFSISAWINPIDATRFSIASKATGSQVEWRFYCDENDKLRLFLADDNISTNEKRVSTASISQNTWTHVAVTYDGSGGTSASSGINLYINGILDNGTASGFGTYVAMHNHSIPVNIGFDDYDDNYADGSISQLGIWKGELTQAQIQSIMESTSYSKIPADVKSTLGSERVLNSDFSDGENLWNLNNANVVNEVLEIDEGAFSYYAQQSVDGGGSNYRQFESGYLMKLEIVVDEYTSGGTIIYATGNNIGTFNSAGTHTIYYKPSVNEYLRLRSNGSGFEGKISSVSIKRVTNDIVAYYPLDGSSSANGVTQDVTTGEVLGSELVSNPSFASNTGWTLGTGWSISSNILSSDGSQSAVSNASASITTSAGLYKVVITVDSISSGTIRPNLQSWGSYISTTGTHTQYFTLTGNNNLTIQASADFVGSISFASVKEVTSNTGVLK
jgi:hypothetical protein